MKQASSSSRALLIVAHGSRRKNLPRVFMHFLKMVRRELPHWKVEGAYLSIGRPSAREQIERLAACFEQLWVWPLLFLPGRHLDRDLPALVARTERKHPHCRIFLVSEWMWEKWFVRDFCASLSRKARKVKL